MKRIITTFIIITVISCLSLKAQDQNQAVEAIEKLVSDGLVTGAIGGYTVNGDITWTHEAGYMDASKKQSFNENTLTRIASISKPMTAVAIMQLYEKGLIEFDIPIQKYLPDFPKNPIGDITVRHLLNQTSGIGGYKSKKEMQNKKEFSSMAEAVAVFQNRALSFIPGSKYQYTTYGYVVLGLIIESVSGVSYEDYMTENIWRKIGMNNTGVEDYDATYQNKSALYHARKGKISPGVKNNLSNRVPGGGIYSSINDLLIFGNALLTDKLITKASLELMINDPGIRKDGNGYGFGWFLYGDNPKYGSVFGHSGEQTGAANQFMILPEINTVVVLLSNTSGAWGDVVSASVKLFEPAFQSKTQTDQVTGR